MSLKSTCQLALDRCIRDKSCTAALTPILQTCDTSRCDRDGCMESLRNFYRTPNVLWNLEIAFCLCKKTDNKEDACMNAQEKLHPVCAQREPNGQLPFCHVLAQTCRENPDCRMRLEMYEQSCAVDSVTKRCAGNTESCRTAVLNMLGTDLRTACACKGTDYNHLYDCLGWQRLLWLNPCVVESQSDFHIKTYGATSTPAFDNGIRTIHEIYTETTNKPTTAVMVAQTTRQPAVILVTIPPRTIINTHEESKIGRNIEVEIVQGGNKEQEAIIIVEPTTVRTTTTTEEQTTTPPTTPSTTTTTEMETTTRTTTTSTTPEPIKYCTVQRPELDDQFVQKGHTKRLYRDAELDCSELCHCDNHLSVSCHAVCVRHAPCRTALAYYSHAAPAYQAYRGRCYCYSGSFICMRPNPGEYSLPPGVYLLLGFSSQDEALLRPHTRLGLEDAVRVLQEYMLTLPDEGTNCTLTLFNVTNENMIITASVPSNQVGNPITLLDNDKMECIGLLETLKSKINSQDYDISSHLLLSIFKIAEVDIIYPPPSSATVKGPSILLMLSALFVLSFLHGKYGIILSHLVMHIVGDLVTKIYIKLVGFMIGCNIHTYRVMTIALEMVAHNIFYFFRNLVAWATLVFFHFFSRHYFNYEKNTSINRERPFGKIVGILIGNDLLNFLKVRINDFIFELKVMPSARLFYEKMCFLYTFIGTKVPSTRLDLRDHDIVITVKHIITAVKNNFMKCIYRCCYNILSVKCIFCRSVHLESMFYSLRNTIDTSLLTKLYYYYNKCFVVVCLLILLYVVNFAASEFTDKFSARIKTDIFLLILYGGFLFIGVQRGGEIEINNYYYYKNIRFDCLQCIFLNNVLPIGYFTLKSKFNIPLCCYCCVASILFLTAVTKVKMAVNNVTKRKFYDFVSFFTFAGTLSVMSVSLFTPEYSGSQIITDKNSLKKNFVDSSNFTEPAPVILLKSIYR